MNIIPVISGIYFLFLGDELVYIGQSRDVSLACPGPRSQCQNDVR
jgi:hypothetical protein